MFWVMPYYTATLLHEIWVWKSFQSSDNIHKLIKLEALSWYKVLRYKDNISTSQVLWITVMLYRS